MENINYKNLEVHLPGFDHANPGPKVNAGINNKASDGYKLWEHVMNVAQDVKKGAPSALFQERLHLILHERDPVWTKSRAANLKKNIENYRKDPTFHPDFNTLEYSDFSDFLDAEKEAQAKMSPSDQKPISVNHYLREKSVTGGVPERLTPERDEMYKMFETGELPDSAEKVKEIEKLLYNFMDLDLKKVKPTFTAPASPIGSDSSSNRSDEESVIQHQSPKKPKTP